MEYAIPIVIVVLIFGTKAFKEVKDYLLKKEQIKADALIRTEALRFKNQIELEKLIQNDQTYNTSQNTNNDADTSQKEHKSDRTRY